MRTFWFAPLVSCLVRRVRTKCKPQTDLPPSRKFSAQRFKARVSTLAPCLFLRLAGCNAWDGKPETRADSACPYCDTDFLPKERLTLDEIMARLEALQTGGVRFGCVLTGGEPLQTDESLLECLSAAFPWVDIETNGTRRLAERPANVFLSCSPKAIPGHKVVCEPDWWKILVPDQLGHLQHALNSGRPVYVQPVPR